MTGKGTLAQRALSAAKWSYLGVLGKLFIQLGSQVILARLLSPADYGLFAVGAIVVGASNFFADASIGAALVQRKNIDDEIIRFVSTWQLIAGLLVTGLIWIFAGLIAAFLNKPEAEDLIRVIAVVCMITAISSTPSNLLRRNLNYKSLQMSQLTGFVIGYLLVGLPMAFHGAGVWSLVTAWIVQASVSTVLVIKAAKPSFGIRFWIPEGGEVLRFGGNALLSNIATWAGSNMDKVVVSKMFGTNELGIYHVVTNLLSTAISQVISTLQSVLFSASSKIQGDNERISKSYLLALEVGFIFLLPVFACIAITSEIVLIGLYGKQWSAGVDLLKPIALAAAMYGMSGMITPLLWASNNIRQESRIQLVVALALAIGCAMAAIFGDIHTVAWTMFAIVSVRYVYIVLFSAITFGVALRDLQSYLWAGGVSTLFCSCFAYIVNHYLVHLLPSRPTLSLVLAALLCAVVFLLSGALMVRYVASDSLRSVFQKIRMRSRANETM